MPLERDSSFQRAVDSALFVRVARIGVVWASLVGLPLAAWGLQRLISSADELAVMVRDTHQHIQLLEQNVKLTLDTRKREIDLISDTVKDHELRIRQVERCCGIPQRGIGHN